ncbi:MAG: sensor histidine kinase [Terrimesophilobacter sp.]
MAIGLTANDGFTSLSIAQAAFIGALSLGFSLAIGFWIRRIFALSAQKQQLIDELQAAEGQLAALHRDAGIASERERLARELHDTTAQSFTGLVMLVQGARRTLDAHNWDETGNVLALIEDSARETLSETRALVASGAAVEVPGGIIPALRRLAERFERETGVTVTVDADSVPTLNRDTEVVLLRCTQEALSNVRKHANATSVTLSVDGNTESVNLHVSDDGTGFDPENAASGFGLAGMRERLALVNGNLHVTSVEGSTVLSVHIPTEVLA